MPEVTRLVGNSAPGLALLPLPQGPEPARLLLQDERGQSLVPVHLTWPGRPREQLWQQGPAPLVLEPRAGQGIGEPEGLVPMPEPQVLQERAPRAGQEPPAEHSAKAFPNLTGRTELARP